MKKEYTDPQIEIIELEKEDIVMASASGCSGDCEQVLCSDAIQCEDGI